jgi:UDP-N-acetylglucosamine 2-epimerase (non-hydrolysing)
MILICFGTRPEYIKVRSLIEHLPNKKTCFTGQHPDLLQDVQVDHKLHITPTTKNRLNEIVINILKHTDIFTNIEYVLVQGDTTTALAMALSAFHHNTKIIHLEAGLRTNNIEDPFPEEANRQLITRLAQIHLCPTELNKQNLLKEGIKESNIFVVGNTGLDNIDRSNCIYENKVLITLHRRNNIPIIDRWFMTIEQIAIEHPEIEFILPIHPNPEIQKHKHLLNRVNILQPQSHSDLIEIMKKTKCIISDSGGIQEEASFLNKKVIICRADTERPEVLEHHGILCKTPEELPEIFEYVNTTYSVVERCPFGDGFAYKKINTIIDTIYGAFNNPC